MRLCVAPTIQNVSNTRVSFLATSTELTPQSDGLYASVFTKDINRALRVARALEAGNVGVNTTSPDGAYELPFGGFKSSGVGRQKGTNSVLDWTEVKSVYIKHD
jgi:acyl-CoA reductase-like NAD-dependent aldehyde dehydrogenase